MNTMENVQLTTKRWENSVPVFPYFSTKIFIINMKARLFNLLGKRCPVSLQLVLGASGNSVKLVAVS